MIPILASLVSHAASIANSNLSQLKQDGKSSSANISKLASFLENSKKTKLVQAG